MLLGTEIGAALTTLEMFDVAVIGMNCATGPKEMNDGVRYLGMNSPKPVSVLPNAGLPQNEGGVRHVQAARRRNSRDFHKQFITEYGVRIVGGCCGTEPEHLKAVVDTCANLEPARRDIEDDRRGGQRVLHGSARPRSQTAGDCRGDEHHHARRALQEHGARAGL